ncbi:MAG: ABC transporter ATP-binding protein [Ruminococcaceae bacterium]|nr:ABC transporter ATP-binding protein [Oscillospiraceae bacterium]
MIKKLASYVKEYKIYAILTPIVMIGEVLMEILIPFVMADIIDKGIEGKDLSYVISRGLLMVLMSFVSLAFGALGGMLGSKAAMGFAKNVRSALFAKVQDFSFGNVDHFSTSSLVTRLTTDVNHVQMAFLMLIRGAVRSPMMLIGAVIMAVRINARLATVFLVAIPILGLTFYLISSTAHPRFKAMLKKYDALNASVQENLIAIRIVKAFVRERHEMDKFEVSADDVRKAQMKAEKVIILNGPVMQLTMYVSILAVLWLGGNMIIGGTFQLGQLASFLTYIGQTLNSLMMLSMLFMMMIISIAAMRRICEVLEEVPDISDADADPSAVLENGSIEFRGVNFSYHKDPEKLNLTDINLKIKSGETVGIIGGTGSAKTSLVQMIPRLYDPLSGSVLVGGRSVKEYSLKTLRDNTAMVLQKNVLFSGTILENLRWGNENATMEEVEQACRNADAYGFITSFPEGFDTYLGQGGVNVSGGQKQRLCIARALLKKPKIIILDDSTSAVDTATDARIRAAFRKELKGTTTLIIAQRISSVQDADRIVVMDDGRISDVGTHEELLQRNEIYKEVYTSQQKGEED